MEQSISTFIFLSFFIAGLEGLETNFTTSKLYRVLPQNEEDINSLRELEEEGFDFWSTPAAVNQTVEVSVESEEEDVQFLKVINERNIPCEVIIANVRSLIDKEMEFIQSAMNAELLDFRDPSFNFERYHSWKEINDFLDDFLIETPSSEEIIIGKTVEGRPLRVIKLSNKREVKERKIVWVDCGIHAREWISPAFCLYTLDRIVTVSPELMNNFDFYILPVFNPDGYVYSWENSRLWRKNRNPQKNTVQKENSIAGLFDRFKLKSNKKCTGVDLNRNFESHWNTVGSSSNPCLDTYHGSKAFSEEETSAVRDFLAPLGTKMAAFFTIHSYSQLIMSPYAYQKEKPNDFDDHQRIMQKGSRAIRKATDEVFFYGPVSKILTTVGGGSTDWAYDALGVKYAFAFEMRDKGNFGFLLPQEQIEPATRESWMGLEAMLVEIAKEYV
uniref:Carboxypeptidase A2 (Pancreatic) [Rattus norvegicus] n=1 Tax=Lepeophtheirus salmonis TaxID=72036 RepID=A0A0K2U9N3_LEPSM